MRLGQLARKLALRPAEIVAFLAANDIQISEEPNTKLEEKHLVLLLQRFAPDLQSSIVTEDDSREEVVAIPLEDFPEKDQAPLEKIPEADVANEDGIQVNKSEEEKVDLIKAPRVELSGLKVLGKIELSEPKKKEPEPTTENESVPEEPKVVRAERRNPNPNFKSQRLSQRSTKNPLALEREREALEAKQKREEEARLQKERRTENYLKKVKNAQPTKAVRLINEPTMEMSAAELKQSPKTWWGKFIKWLTT